MQHKCLSRVIVKYVMYLIIPLKNGTLGRRVNHFPIIPPLASSTSLHLLAMEPTAWEEEG